MLQLHPFYATVTRPVYHDRAGTLYRCVECPECKGDGGREYACIDPSERGGFETCAECGGTGQAFVEIAEDDLLEDVQ